MRSMSFVNLGLPNRLAEAAYDHSLDVFVLEKFADALQSGKKVLGLLILRHGGDSTSYAK